MRVLKFGGSSIADAKGIASVCRIVARRQGEPMVLVFSAVGDTTDRLEHLASAAAARDVDRIRHEIAVLKCAHLALLDAVCPPPDLKEKVSSDWEGLFHDLEQIAVAVAVLGELSPTVRARLLGFGELLSTRLLVAALSANGVPSVWVDARDLIIAAGDPTNGEPVTDLIDRRCGSVLHPLLASHLVPLTQGFIASAVDGAPATLGRGGSDYTAALIGASLTAEEIEIWTDVDGVMTADPRLVPQARCVAELTLEEAAQIASFGARVLHPRTIVPAIERGVAVRVRNTHRSREPGTLIRSHPAHRGDAVRSIAYRAGFTLISLEIERRTDAWGVLDRALDVFTTNGVDPKVVSTSDATVIVGCRSAPPGLLDGLSSLATVSVTPHQAVVGVVGEGVAQSASALSSVFKALGGARVAMASIGGSSSAFGFFVDEHDAADVVRRLHHQLFEWTDPESAAAFSQRPPVARTA